MGVDRTSSMSDTTHQYQTIGAMTGNGHYATFPNDSTPQLPEHYQTVDVDPAVQQYVSWRDADKPDHNHYVDLKDIPQH